MRDRLYCKNPIIGVPVHFTWDVRFQLSRGASFENFGASGGHTFIRKKPLGPHELGPRIIAFADPHDPLFATGFCWADAREMGEEFLKWFFERGSE